MPATEQTWRNVKLMHVVFGVSGFLMFAATIWMLAADHIRPWKPYQRSFQKIENWRSAARITEEQSADFQRRQTELQAAIDEAAAAAPPQDPIDDFAAELRSHDKQEAADGVLGAYASLSENPSHESRDEFISLLRGIARQARFDEDNIALKLKFRKAELDVARADYELGVGGALSTEQLNELQSRIDIITTGQSRLAEAPADAVEQSVNHLTLALQAANTHRKKLDAALTRATADETAARTALADHNVALELLRKSYATLSRPSRGVLTLPILDAFNSPLEIKQIWLPDLTIKNGSFGKVARFDRCTTCHQGIDRTAPGSAVAPFFEHDSLVQTALATPETAPAVEDDASRQSQISDVYGLVLAESGLLRDDDVTVEVVWPETAAAMAQLLPGDVIVRIGDVEMGDRAEAERYLLDSVVWGEPLALTVRRGLPHPYSTHPRLDLFLGSTSPHKTAEFGCTICHEGQGSATSFEWASHTPNDLLEMERWQDEHGWFHNHHWIFPMPPKRFVESNCLKCHHEVVDLLPSERYPDPPAPKLLAGFDVIRQYGCFGCHEINGYDGPDRRIGPDLRTEPNYAPGAQQLLSDAVFAAGSDELAAVTADLGRRLAQLVLDDEPADEVLAALAARVSLDATNPVDVRALSGLVAAQEDLPEETQQLVEGVRLALEARSKLDEAAALAESVIADPTDDAARRRLIEIVRADAALGPAEAEGGGGLFSAGTQALLPVLADTDTPGALRKPGPSLRYVGSKLDRDFLFDWIANPANFRPTTRMPRFFGLLDHLREEPRLDEHGEPILAEQVDDDGNAVLDEGGHAVTSPEMQESPGLATALKYEPLEIRAAVEYLLHSSQPFEYAPRPEEVPEDYEPSAERGRTVFQLRGCLACHQHSEATTDIVGSNATQGPDLTRMGAKLSQAAADDALYGWETRGAQWLYSWVKEPNRYHTRTVMPDVFLDPIVVEEEWTDPAADVTAYLLSSQSAPAGEDADEADEEAETSPWRPGEVPELNERDLRDLVLEHLRDKFTNSQSEAYVEDGIPLSLAGEIKGDEALLLGELTDENRVERQLQYVGRRTISKYGCAGCHDIPGFEDAKPIGTGLADWARKDLSQLAFEQISAYITRHGDFGNGHGGHLELRDMPADTGMMLHALLNHHREGFLWQKLREPRGYDYKKTENKKYNERLRMPKFNLDQAQIEQVMTFVLGLVAEPPAAEYVYNPPPRERAIVEGRKVLEKFNCAGCHELQGERWEFEFDPNYAISEGDQPYAAAHPFPADEYDVFRPDFTPAELAASERLDRRGRGRATVFARKELDSEGDPAEFEDDDGNILHSFALWKPAAINGKSWLPSEKVLVRTDWITRHRPAEGGDLARMIYPLVLEEELDRNPARAADDVWGWVPPPLIHEGNKVKSDWLHAFLLDPYPIRPATVLRMPKFNNLSPAEATAVVNYFAAVDNARYPYEFDSRRSGSHLAAEETRFPGRLDDALKIATNGNYCVQCHLVGEYVPTRQDKAPNLARVHERLRPEYLQPWLSNPKRLLPYTGMPVNFPLLKPLDPKLFPTAGELIQEGGSPQQLDAVVDWLLNYDTFMKQKFQIAPLVTQPTPEQPAGEGAPAEAEEDAEAAEASREASDADAG